VAFFASRFNLPDNKFNKILVITMVYFWLDYMDVDGLGSLLFATEIQ